MYESAHVVYLSGWSEEQLNGPFTDPFYDILRLMDIRLSYVNAIPENCHTIDLLIFHPMQMSSEVFDSIERLKTECPAIKTVVISSAHGSDLFLQAIDVGVDKYLLKPLLPGALKKVVERLVSQSMEGKKSLSILQQNKMMFGAISQTSLVIRIGQDSKIKEINPLLTLLIGYDRREILGRYWLRFVDRRFLVYLRTLVKARIESGDIYRGIIEIIDVRGNRIPIDTTIYAVLNQYGSIDEIFFIGHDLSATKKAILESMRQLIDYDTSLAVVFDHRYELIMANQTFLDTYGFNTFDALLSSCSLWKWTIENESGSIPLFPAGSDQKKGLETIIRMLKQGRINGKVVSESPDKVKSYYTVHYSSMANPLIQNEHYNILYFIDVTDMERYKEAQITDAKLISVGRLAAAITHEINTPLTYIKGNLELIKMELEDHHSSQMELFEPIDEGIKRIQSIIGAMYEFSGTGREEMQPCNVLKTLIYALRIISNRSKHLVEVTLNGEKIGPETVYDENECLTFGISTRLEQVWIIILNNALDEFEKGNLPFDERSLEITSRRTEEGISIRISDNAGGIPEPMLESIFDFAVGSNKKKSMGIGLNVAKAIVDKHGGKIEVHNKNGGAEFEIVLRSYKGEVK